MQQLSYGITKPKDLLAKLQLDAKHLGNTPDPYHVFNFVVTASVLADWTQKFYKSEPIFAAPSKKNKNKKWLLPDASLKWITDTSCLPNPYRDHRLHIANALSICCHVANASKHFHWKDYGEVNAIGQKPQIRDFNQYCFTSLTPDLYVEFQGENYGIQQIKGILLQFFPALLDYMDNLEERA